MFQVLCVSKLGYPVLVESDTFLFSSHTRFFLHYLSCLKLPLFKIELFFTKCCGIISIWCNLRGLQMCWITGTIEQKLANQNTVFYALKTSDEKSLSETFWRYVEWHTIPVPTDCNLQFLSCIFFNEQSKETAWYTLA